MGSRRSLEDIQDLLAKESAWRKRELGTLSILIQGARSHEKELLQRAAIALAYAHWEGYIKNAVEVVLTYLSRQGLKLCDVNPSLLARGLERDFRSVAETRKHAPMVEIVQLLRSDLRSACRIETVVSTKSNLNREVFEDLMSMLGIDASRVFDAQQGVTDIDIDERLLARRNHIAHGSYVVPDEGECRALMDAVRALMEAATTALVTYLANGEYRSIPSSL